MSLNLTPNDDFAQIVDGQEYVRLVRYGDLHPIDVHHALSRPVRSTAGLVAGGRQMADAIWHLPESEVPEAPRVGDFLLDEQSRRWTLLNIEHSPISRRWRCTGRDLVAAFGLNERVDIQTAAPARSDHGAAESTWTTWKTGIQAAIRPTGTKSKTTNGRRETRRRLALFIQEDFDLDHRHRIRTTDGTYYRVLETIHSGRIDEPLEIHIEPFDE